MVALQTKFKYIDTYYRYTSEVFTTFLATLGATVFPIVPQTLLFFYVADLVVNRLCHPLYFTRQNAYYNRPFMATFLRAGRNAAHYGIAYVGMNAFLSCVEISFFNGMLTTAVVMLLLKAAVEMLYTAAEDSQQTRSRSCHGCGSKGILSFL